MFKNTTVLSISGRIYQYFQRSLTMTKNRWDDKTYVICESFFFQAQLDPFEVHAAKVEADTIDFLECVGRTPDYIDPRIELDDVRQLLHGRIVSGSEWHGPVGEQFPDDQLIPAFVRELERRKLIAIEYEWPHTSPIASAEEISQRQKLRPDEVRRPAHASLDGKPIEYTEEGVGIDSEQVAGMPFNGAPGAWASSMPGKMLQLRQYGADGRPLTDFDLEAHHGNPNPHAHNWSNGARDEGAPVSSLRW